MFFEKIAFVYFNEPTYSVLHRCIFRQDYDRIENVVW